MKKIAILKKKLTRFALKAIIMIAVCAGIFYFVNDYLMQQTTKIQQIESEINQKRNDIVKIEDNVSIYEKSFTLFQQLTKQIDAGKYELDIARNSKVLELLGRKHRITNLSVDISVKEKLGDVDYAGFIPIIREVNLGFSAMSDAHIYAFLDNIKQYFTGYLQFSKITITQKRKLDYNVLAEVSKGATPELLEAKISFLWLGIEKKPDEKKPSEMPSSEPR